MPGGRYPMSDEKSQQLFSRTAPMRHKMNRDRDRTVKRGGWRL